MSYKPLVVYCLRELDCPLLAIVREAYRAGLKTQQSLNGNGVSPERASKLAVRILRVNPYDDNFTELWVRVSGDRCLVEAFDKALRVAKEVYFQQIYSNKFNRVLRIVIPRSKCSKCLDGDGRIKCPLISSPPGSMAKTVIIMPSGALYELIVSRSSTCEELKQQWGCKPIYIHGIDEYDYMLTEKQELALIYAYLLGYYNFPRKASLKGLAARLGLSVSTLAELLRKAEAKVVEAFVRHELPHYLVERVLDRRNQLEAIEERLGAKSRSAGSSAEDGRALEERPGSPKKISRVSMA